MERSLHVVILADESPEQSQPLCELPPAEWLRLAAGPLHPASVQIAEWDRRTSDFGPRISELIARIPFGSRARLSVSEPQPPASAAPNSALPSQEIRSEIRSPRSALRTPHSALLTPHSDKPPDPIPPVPSTGDLLVLFADRPLLTTATLRAFLANPQSFTPKAQRTQRENQVFNPQSAIQNHDHETHEPHEKLKAQTANQKLQSDVVGPKPEVQCPMSESTTEAQRAQRENQVFNPQSAIRNPQLEESATRNPQFVLGDPTDPAAVLYRAAAPPPTETEAITTEAQRTQSADQAEHRTSDIEHRTSNSDPKPEVRSPMSADSPFRRFADSPFPSIGASTEELPPRLAEFLPVRDARARAEAEACLQERIRAHWLAAGVTLRAPGRTWIGPRVRLVPPLTLWWDVALLGETRLGAGCEILPGSFLENARLGERVRVEHSVIRDAEVEGGTTVGPFAHLRGGARIGPDNRIGNFVEVKKSVTGAGTKASHLAYLGDATIGAHVNVGAGTITCNYDGVKKHPTIIGDGAFIGSDTILVAPVEVGAGAYTGAGSTVTEPVPPDSLALGRARQRNVLGWAARHRAAQAAGTESHHRDTKGTKSTGESVNG